MLISVVIYTYRSVYRKSLQNKLKTIQKLTPLLIIFIKSLPSSHAYVYPYTLYKQNNIHTGIILRG